MLGAVIGVVIAFIAIIILLWIWMAKMFSQLSKMYSIERLHDLETRVSALEQTPVKSAAVSKIPVKPKVQETPADKAREELNKLISERH
jgi:hypothetical protein